MWGHIEMLQIAEMPKWQLLGQRRGRGRSLEEKGTFFQQEIQSNQSSRGSWDEEVLVLLSSLPCSPGTGRGLQYKKVKKKPNPR